MTIVILKLLASILLTAFALDEWAPKSKLMYFVLNEALPWVFIVLLFLFGINLIWFGWV